MPSPRRPMGWLPALLALLALAHAGSAAAEPPPSRAESLRQEALALATADDSESLDRAAALLDEALRANPGEYRARADRALVELLVSSGQRDEAVQLAPLEGDALMQGGRELRERALDELRPLVKEHAADLAVARALAVYYGLEGDAARTAKLVAQARAANAADAWTDFAECAAEARSAGRDAALSRLAAFAASHPNLLRPRMMLARALLDGSRRDEALGVLEEILAANPRHDGAQRQKARLLSPPPARVAAVPVPEDAPPPRPGGFLPHKRSPHSRDASRMPPAHPASATDPG